MKRPTIELINVLEAERIRRKLNHHAFSTLLGIHESYWHRIRTGERPLNLNLLTIFMQKLPEVTPEVTIYIMRQGNDGGEDKNPGEKTPGGQNPTGSQKTSTKTGGKNTSPYLGDGNTPNNARKPSKNASGG